MSDVNCMPHHASGPYNKLYSSIYSFINCYSIVVLSYWCYLILYYRYLYMTVKQWLFNFFSEERTLSQFEVCGVTLSMETGKITGFKAQMTLSRLTANPVILQVDKDRVVNKYGWGGEGWCWNRGGVNSFRELRGVLKFLKVHIGTEKLFELLYLKDACQYYWALLHDCGMGAGNNFYVCEGGLQIFSMHSRRGMNIFTITEHFNMPPAIIVDNSIRIPSLIWAAFREP